MRQLTVLCAIVLFSGLLLGQDTTARRYVYCPYGCGPFIPLVTTPSVSLQTVSPNPVGARNATGGLVAGATNSTLSMVPVSSDAVYTEPVWYSGGGTPIIGPAVKLPPGYARPLERREVAAPVKHEAWTYFASAEETANAVEASAQSRSVKKAARTYTNQDVDRQSQQPNTVKYGGKTQEIK